MTRRIKRPATPISISEDEEWGDLCRQVHTFIVRSGRDALRQEIVNWFGLSLRTVKAVISDLERCGLACEWVARRNGKYWVTAKGEWPSK